jgi:Bacterial regulatory proteins, tetR family
MAKTSEVVDLRERCVTEALAIIREQGVEQLSLRDVARRIGVSQIAMRCLQRSLPASLRASRPILIVGRILGSLRRPHVARSR